MILDVESNRDIIVGIAASTFFDNEKRRRLPAAPVASAGLATFECGEQTLGETARGFFERLRHLIDDLRAGQYVALRGIVLTFFVSRPIGSLGAGEHREVAFRVDDRDLSTILTGKRVLRQ